MKHLCGDVDLFFTDGILSPSFVAFFHYFYNILPYTRYNNQDIRGRLYRWNDMFYCDNKDDERNSLCQRTYDDTDDNDMMNKEVTRFNGRLLSSVKSGQSFRRHEGNQLPSQGRCSMLS